METKAYKQSVLFILRHFFPCCLQVSKLCKSACQQNITDSTAFSAFTANDSNNGKSDVMHVNKSTR